MMRNVNQRRRLHCVQHVIDYNVRCNVGNVRCERLRRNGYRRGCYSGCHGARREYGYGNGWRRSRRGWQWHCWRRWRDAGRRGNHGAAENAGRERVDVRLRVVTLRNPCSNEALQVCHRVTLVIEADTSVSELL
jgi:hypothetical protein